MAELNQIFKDGHIDKDQFERIRSAEAGQLFSIHWELRTILYIGILLLSSGIGILVYLDGGPRNFTHLSGVSMRCRDSPGDRG